MLDQINEPVPVEATEEIETLRKLCYARRMCDCSHCRLIETGSDTKMLLQMIFALAKVAKVEPKEFAEQFKTQAAKNEYFRDFTIECIKI